MRGVSFTLAQGSKAQRAGDFTDVLDLKVEYGRLMKEKKELP